MTAVAQRIPYAAGPMSEVVAVCRDLWGRVRGGAYFFKRGPIEYGTHVFAAKPRTVSMQVDQRLIFQPEKSSGCEITFEVGAQIELSGTEAMATDDGLQDEMVSDLVWVLSAMRTSTYPGRRDSLFKGIFPQNSPVDEWHDQEAGLQGIVITFHADF